MDMDRKTFMALSAMSAAAPLVARSAAPLPVIRVGIIGLGMRGKGRSGGSR